MTTKKLTILELIDMIVISPQLIKLITNVHNRMMGQLKLDFASLNGIYKYDENKIFDAVGVDPQQLSSILDEYPANVYLVREVPLYTLLTAIVIKAFQDGETNFANMTYILMGLIIFARLKYRYIRIVNPGFLERALAKMSRRTYIGVNGFAWTIYKVCNDTLAKYKDEILKNPALMMPRYRSIIDLRNKFNQIMKHVASLYYYVYQNQNEVDSNTMMTTLTDKIVVYLVQNTLPTYIFETIDRMTKANDIDKVYELHHQVQIKTSYQSKMYELIFFLIKRYFDLNEIFKSQYERDIDLMDMSFVTQFYLNLKKSTIAIKLIDHDMFRLYNFSKDLVLAYGLITMIYAKSNIEASKAYESSSSSSSNVESEKDYSREYSSSFNESIINFSELFEREDKLFKVIEEATI